MNFIGNDIIDLKTAKTQTHKLGQRSLEKIFNSSEVAYINNQVEAMLAYWHLWSVKESAYKAWQRMNEAEPIFNPLSFVCLDIQSDSVVVENDDFRCKVKTSRTSEYIYSECYSDKFESKIFKTPESYKSWLMKMAEKNWVLEKSRFNIPSFYNISSQQRTPASISHDGNYVAVVWQKDSLDSLDK